MLTKFTGRFSKDLDKLKQASVKKEILKIIEEVELAPDASAISNLKKLKGFANAFRIRTGDYRAGIFIENNTVEFVRVAHRKDIYNVFP